jgi:hypothetical protein
MDAAMPTLTDGNGFTTTIPGLGRNQNFPNLSERRIRRLSVLHCAINTAMIMWR